MDNRRKYAVIDPATGKIDRRIFSDRAVYDDEMENTTVRAVCVDPGAMRTRMRAGAFPGEDPETLPPPEAHGDALVQLALPACTMNGEWVAGDAALQADSL